MLKQWQQHFGLMSPLLVNMYGITETTVHSSWHIISNDDLEHTESIIGELLPGFDYIIRPLDESDLRSGYGELLLCGSQVTPGYLNQNNETNGKFILAEKTILPSGIIAQEILFNIIPQGSWFIWGVAINR